jgi:hypothetical protein
MNNHGLLETGLFIFTYSDSKSNVNMFVKKSYFIYSFINIPYDLYRFSKKNL